MGLWTPESKNGELNTSSMGCRSCVMLCGEKWILQKYFGQVFKKNQGYLFLTFCDIWIIMREVPIVTPGSPDVMSQRLFGNAIATFGIYTRASSKVFPPPGLLGFVTVHLVKVTVFPFCIIPPQSSRPLGLKEKSMYKDFNVRASSMR